MDRGLIKILKIKELAQPGFLKKIRAILCKIAKR